VSFTNYIRVLFIDKANVLPGHVGVLNRRQYSRLQAYMRAIVGHVLDRIQCARAHVTALNSHGIGNEAMAARVM
jgi:hypothetical protein